MIIRSWICENSRCGNWFDASEANPKCPKCQCVRVSWRPNGGHIAGASKGADAELRALADIFKLGDLNSAERGRAAKKVATPAPPDPHSAPMHTFAPGFVAPVAAGGAAACLPSAAKVDFKVKATPGSRLAPNGSFPGMRSNTSIEGVHKA